MICDSVQSETCSYFSPRANTAKDESLRGASSAIASEASTRPFGFPQCVFLSARHLFWKPLELKTVFYIQTYRDAGLGTFVLSSQKKREG